MFSAPTHAAIQEISRKAEGFEKVSTLRQAKPDPQTSLPSPKKLQ